MSSEATSSSGSARLPAIATPAPVRAYSRAIARPRPVPPPVTSATSPSFASGASGERYTSDMRAHDARPIPRTRSFRSSKPSLTRRPPGGSTWLVGSRLDELARATPATRDRYVDFLRAASIVAVVFGHWFISINHLERDIYSTPTAVGLTSGMWLATWLFQVMPVFFFVGGFSNLVTYDAFQRRGEPSSAFVRSRLERLLRPSLVFLGSWLIVQVALHLFDVGGAAGPRLVGETRCSAACIRRRRRCPSGPCGSWASTSWWCASRPRRSGSTAGSAGGCRPSWRLERSSSTSSASAPISTSSAT